MFNPHLISFDFSKDEKTSENTAVETEAVSAPEQTGSDHNNQPENFDCDTGLWRT